MLPTSILFALTPIVLRPAIAYVSCFSLQEQRGLEALRRKQAPGHCCFAAWSLFGQAAPRTQTYTDMHNTFVVIA